MRRSLARSGRPASPPRPPRPRPPCKDMQRRGWECVGSVSLRGWCRCRGGWGGRRATYPGGAGKPACMISVVYPVPKRDGGGVVGRCGGWSSGRRVGGWWGSRWGSGMGPGCMSARGLPCSSLWSPTGDFKTERDMDPSYAGCGGKGDASLGVAGRKRCMWAGRWEVGGPPVRGAPEPRPTGTDAAGHGGAYRLPAHLVVWSILYTVGRCSNSRRSARGSDASAIGGHADCVTNVRTRSRKSARPLPSREHPITTSAAVTTSSGSADRSRTPGNIPDDRRRTYHGC